MKPRRMALAAHRLRRLPAVMPSRHRAAWRRLSLCWERRKAGTRITPLNARVKALQQYFHTLVRVHVTAPRTLVAAAAVPATAPWVHSLTSRLVERTQVDRGIRAWQQARKQSARELWRHNSQTVLEHRSHRLLPMAQNRSRLARTTPRAPAAAANPRNASVRSGFDAQFRPRNASAATDSAKHSTSIRRPPEGTTPVEYRPRMPAVMVWQKPARADASADDTVFGRSTLPPAPATRALAHGAPLPPAAASPTQVQQIARETQRALLLDPTVTDRLAEDVMRRVDKRLRIERERRGL